MDTFVRLYLVTIFYFATLMADAQQQDGPIIIPNETELVLENDQNFTMLCKWKSPVRFVLQDIPEEEVGQFTFIHNSYKTDDAEYPFRAKLDLYHVNTHAIRYYACAETTVDARRVLRYVQDELENTKNMTFVYIYVNGTESLMSPLRQYIYVPESSTFVIACRPTIPDIEVSLTLSDRRNIRILAKFSKIGFVVDVDRFRGGLFLCRAQKGNKTQTKSITISTYVPQKPTITGSPYFFEGRPIVINCSTPLKKDMLLMLEIYTPNGKINTNDSRMSVEENQPSNTLKTIYTSLKVFDTTKDDAGTYKCVSTTVSTTEAEMSETFDVKLLTPEEAFVNLSRGAHPYLIESRVAVMMIRLGLNAYPEVNVTIYKNGKKLFIDGKKYVADVRDREILFTITNFSLGDTAKYTIVADNGYKNDSQTFDIRKNAKPSVIFGRTGNSVYHENANANIMCRAFGYPLPKVVLTFAPFCDADGCLEQNLTSTDDVKSLYEVNSHINISATISGNITCSAYNKFGSAAQTTRFLVYELDNAFGIKDRMVDWFPENQNITLTCLASKFHYNNVTWLRDNISNDSLHQVFYYESPHSYVAELKIWQVSLNDANTYKCIGFCKNGSIERENITITVAEIQPPEIFNQSSEEYIEVKPFGPVELRCLADSVPAPTIVWYKDDEMFKANGANTAIRETILNHTVVESVVIIKQTEEEDKGKYRCEARSGHLTADKYYTLTLKEKSNRIYLSIIGVIGFLLVILTIYLIWKIRKEKQFKRELDKAGLLHFKEGAAHSLNPDLAIDDQAELLPYDEKFEFPPEKLTLGKQLGSGAYGVVYKAEARGIINAEETTTVAVKTVKKTADNMYIKALISELKIMIHLGKHINILNLLGACTKNVAKRELNVIMEYCKFGSIDIYMKQHREVFIDQLSDGDRNGFGRINRGFSTSSGHSGSDYCGSSHTQATDHTFLTTGNTGKRKESETEYVQAEWRSNYVIEYEGRILRPLYSRDLLCWAFQIARGMEYLASRKVLHGDLAARNILLTEDNIVKICDFGLAKSIYKNDEYQKKGNIPLPVKWLAIECITDRTFSTQSDVWAFGIVLWELFTLAKTPYPNMHHTQLLPWLLEGNRLSKPRYADDRLYKVMLQCWDQNPTARPSFTHLQETLGSFLEDNVRNHYVDLNAPYLDSNAANQEHEDYLAMVSAPDYTNVMRPRYTNTDTLLQLEQGAPPPLILLQDEEGYLAMSPSPHNRQVIFSPRPNGDKFDFDSRRLNLVSEANGHGSELTPMLTLNNLPARGGSESDHEGSASPYLNMCPRIEEETDEVFETKENLRNTDQSRAVTNPTYIAYDSSLEKKPQDISYANVPNGLVN